MKLKFKWKNIVEKIYNEKQETHVMRFRYFYKNV